MARRWTELVPVMASAVDAGLHGVAVLSPAGHAVGVHGALDPHEVRALATLVSRDGPADLLRRLFDGELATAMFDHRPVFLGIAARCVFVVAVGGEDRRGGRRAAEKLVEDVDALIRYSRSRLGNDWVPPTEGSSGSGSPPAEAFVWPPDPKRLPN